MSVHNNKNRPSHPMTRQSNVTGWVLGGLALFAVLALIMWGTGGNNNTASTSKDANTGTVTAPAPATPATPSPGTPPRP